MKRILCLVLILALLIGCGANSNVVRNEKKNDPIKIAYLELSAFLPDFIAKEKGYFEEEGLDVKFIEYSEGTTMLNDVVLGRIDKALIGITSYLPIEAQSPGGFQIFYPVYETTGKSASCMLVRTDSEIEDISELKGKRFGTYIGTTQKLLLKLIYKNVFGSTDAAETIQVDKSLQIQSLVDGQFDALMTIEPYCSIALSKGMAKVLEADPRSKYVMDPYPVGGGFFSTKFVEERPDDAEKMVRAFDKALQFIKDNEYEAKKMLPTFTKLTEDIAPHTKFYVMGTSDDVDHKFKQRTQEMADILYEEGILENKLDTSGIYYEPESDKEKVVVGHRGHLLYLPVYVAVENGYFEEEGIEPELVFFDSTNTMIEAMLMGRVDTSFGGVNIPALFHLQQSSPDQMKIFSVSKLDEDNYFQMILVRSDSDITDVKHLVGKRVGVFLGSTARMFMEKLKEIVGGDFEYIQMKPSLLLNALEAGQVDAILTLEPQGTMALNMGDFRSIYDAFYLKHFSDMLSTSVMPTKFIEDNPELAEKIVRVADKAVNYINENPREAAKFLTKYTNVDEEVIDDLMIVYYMDSDEVSAEPIQEFADQLHSWNQLEKEIDVQGMIYG